MQTFWPGTRGKRLCYHECSVESSFSRMLCQRDVRNLLDTRPSITCKCAPGRLPSRARHTCPLQTTPGLLRWHALIQASRRETPGLLGSHALKQASRREILCCSTYTSWRNCFSAVGVFDTRFHQPGVKQALRIFHSSPGFHTSTDTSAEREAAPQLCVKLPLLRPLFNSFASASSLDIPLRRQTSDTRVGPEEHFGQACLLEIG